MSSSSLRNVHVSLRNVHVWPGSLVHLTWVLGTRSFCEGFAATEAPKRFCVGSYASRAANRGPLEWSEWPWGPRIPSRMSGNLREKTLQKGCVWSRAKIFERAAKQGHEDDGFQDCHPHEFKLPARSGGHHFEQILHYVLPVIGWWQAIVRWKADGK